MDKIMGLINPAEKQQLTKGSKSSNKVVSREEAIAIIDEQYRMNTTIRASRVLNVCALRRKQLLLCSQYSGHQCEHATAHQPVERRQFVSTSCCFCSWHFELEKPVDSPEEGLTMDVNGVKVSYVGAPTVFASSESKTGRSSSFGSFD